MAPEPEFGGPESGEPPVLVEHFFRHESAHLVAVLTRAFGVRHLDLVEDQVQEALLQAMESWGRRGIPRNPAGWLYRVARNRMLDALRRETIHQRALAHSRQTEEGIDSLVEGWLSEEQLPDSLLRMIFVCCHPSLDVKSQLATTLKILCGFSLNEISRGLLIGTEAAKKRVQRAKKALREAQIEVDLPPPEELHSRLGTVHRVLYLMFNEGYSTSEGHEPLRDDICEEAARLCHLLAEHEVFGTPETQALLALMLAHASRLEARVDAEGAVVLLEDQDRAQWDRRLILIAEHWLERSKTNTPSRYHYEAAISLAHCRARSLGDTDWPRITQLYDRLCAIHSSPLYVLNRAIARAEAGEVEEALSEMEALRRHPAMKDYYLLDCAVGRLHERGGRPQAARAAYESARKVARACHERVLIEKKLAGLVDSGS